MKQRLAVLLMLGLMPWAELYAQSQTASTTFRVSARVENVCSVSANDLNFGTYSQQTGSNGTTQLRAVCSPQATYSIGLNEGTGGGTITGGRLMASPGGQKLQYQLYSDSSRTAIWGNTAGQDMVTGVGTGLAQDHTVFGAIPGTQSIPAGDYGDTITVRIYY